MPKTGRIDRRNTGPGESDKGASADLGPSARSRGEPFPNSRTHGLRMATGHADRPPLLPVGLRHMQIEPHSSNRIARPLGTGCRSMHALNATTQWCRSANEPRGTAQGNRGSITQGGDRIACGLLPFKTASADTRRPEFRMTDRVERRLELSPAGRRVKARRPVSSDVTPSHCM